MMGVPTKETGDIGEEISCSYLESLGHLILERNWRAGHLEIDIISKDVDGLHFVEVKTRRPPVCASPEENVGPVKRRRVTQAANFYLHSRRHGDTECHFDIISIILNGSGKPDAISYFPDAWLPIFT